MNRGGQSTHSNRGGGANKTQISWKGDRQTTQMNRQGRQINKHLVLIHRSSYRGGANLKNVWIIRMKNMFFSFILPDITNQMW